MTVTVDAFRLISRAQGEYARCIDDGRMEDWPGFFEEDCHYRITTAANHSEGLQAGVIWADNRRMLTDRVSALLEANIYEAHTYRHILGQPAILEESDEGARSETGFRRARHARRQLRHLRHRALPGPLPVPRGPGASRRAGRGLRQLHHRHLLALPL